MLNAIRTLTCAVLLGALTGAQEGPVLPDNPLSPSDPVEELKQLFLDVEQALERIDDELADAGAGMTELAEVEDAGLDDLLRQAMKRSEQAQSKIDRILEIAAEMNQGQSGGSSQQQQESQGSQGESPLDQQQGGAPRERENTPEAPRPGGEEPQGEEQQGEEEEQQEGQGEKPDSGQESQESGENRDGRVQPDEEGAAVPHGDEKDGWGYLPERVQEVFRNQGRDDLPVRYRDWIDTYYKRLNQSSR